MPIIRPNDPTTYTEASDADGVTGTATNVRFSDTGGLTQFGAFTETLSPGARSSLCHWHQREDEFVYMLSGQVTVYEGGVASLLNPGEAVCFKAGVPQGHYLENHTAAPATYLIVGTRLGADVVTYPDHDRILTYDDATGTESFTTLDGTPGVGSAYRLPGA